MNLQLPVLSVPVTTIIASANPAHGDEYSIQQCEIMFVSDLHKVKSPLGLVLYCYLNMPTINKTYLILSYVDGFLRVLRILPPINLAATI
jgi:hypothetical protein